MSKESIYTRRAKKAPNSELIHLNQTQSMALTRGNMKQSATSDMLAPSCKSFGNIALPKDDTMIHAQSDGHHIHDTASLPTPDESHKINMPKQDIYWKADNLSSNTSPQLDNMSLVGRLIRLNGE